MPAGQKIKMYYDPRGNVIRTVNPDNSEQWVIHGKPNNLGSVTVKNSWSFEGYEPTPWESYTYDANDLGGITHPGLGTISTHWNTPAVSVIDPLGRTVKTTSLLDNNIIDNGVVMKYSFDIQGNLLITTDSLGRIVFKHKYGLGKELLWKEHLDSGISTTLADAEGKPVEAADAKQAHVYTSYDSISRPEKVWARDNGSEPVTLRQVSVYAESLGLSTAANLNLLGKIYQSYDESGLNQIEECDFKGNPLEKLKQVINDDELLNAGTSAYTVDWTGLDTGVLDTVEYRTTVEYDALNRGIKVILPADINSDRAVIEPEFNRGGALEKIKKDGTEYVERIAYNAKGQQLLVAWKNDVMMRFTYDSQAFRLKRVKAEKFDDTVSLNYSPESGTSRYDQQYIYDLVGNIMAVNDATPDCGISGSTNELQRLFKYDALYRLIYAHGREDNSVSNLYWTDITPSSMPNANNCRMYTQQYEYDKVGNIQNLTHTASGNNYTRHYNYQAGNNKLNSIDDGQGPPTTLASFTYSNTGTQLTANSERFYEWNYADRMRCFYIEAGIISKFAHYIYDAAGTRIKKLVLDQYGNYESVTYIDGIFEYHKKVTDTGTTVKQKNYIQVQGGVEIRVGGYTGIDDSIPDTLYTISDYLTSAAIRLKADAGMYDKEEYYPYGESSLRTIGQKRYRFTGKERDNESGLYYMNARYYCSGTAKFLSADPLAGEFTHQSSYCYADCNPVIKTDPSGMGAEHNEPEQKSVDNTKNLDKENKGFIDNTKTFLAGEVKRLKDVITGMEKVVDDKFAQKKEKDYRNVTIGKRYDKLPESTRKTISKEDYIKSETLKERNKELENRGINNYKEQLKNAESLQKFYDTHSFTNNSLILGGIINNEAGVYDQTSKQWVGHAYLNKVGGSVRHPKGAEISNYSKLQSKWDNLKAEQKVSFLTNLSTSIGAADTVITDHAKGIDPTTGATHWLSPMAPIFDASSGGNTQKRTINNKVRYLPNWARANNDAKLKDLQKGPNAILNSDYKEIVLNSNFYFYKGVK